VGEDFMIVGELDAKHGVGKELGDAAFHFDRLLFSHSSSARSGLSVHTLRGNPPKIKASGAILRMVSRVYAVHGPVVRASRFLCRAADASKRR
jgi:hypothetical protein